MQRDTFGVWSVTLPAVHGRPAIPHDSKVKVIRSSAFQGTHSLDHHDHPSGRTNRQASGMDQASHPEPRVLTYLRRHLLESPQQIRLQEQAASSPIVSPCLRSARYSPAFVSFLMFQSEFPPRSTASVLILNSRQMSCPESKSLDTTSFSSWQSWNTPIMHPLDTRSPASLLPQADMVVSFPINTPDITRNP